MLIGARGTQHLCKAGHLQRGLNMDLGAQLHVLRFENFSFTLCLSSSIFEMGKIRFILSPYRDV